MQTASLVPDRLVVAAAVVLTCVLFLPSASDPVNIVKLSALLTCAVVALALAVARVARDRVLQVPAGPAAWAGLAMLLAFLVATAASPRTATAVYGTLGRNSGLLAYGAAVLLFAVTLRVFDAPSTRVVLLGVLLAGLFTGLYGLLQYRGIDAVGWNNPFNPIIAGLGNPDFASGYLGIAAPAAAWGALYTGWHVVLRAASALTLVLLLLVAALSSAVQGPLAAAAGLAVLLVAWLLGAGERVRRSGLAALGVLVLLGLATLGLGVTGSGPASSFFSGISYKARTWYWEAALTMFRHSPVWGVGLDSYGIRWGRDRPIEVPRQLGGDHYSDAAHSVPLQMLAQGGVVLGLAYLAFVVLVAVVLVRGLLRTSGQERLLLGGLGGCWAAYQVQSVVSIDQVPLLVVHFALAAAVVIAAGGVRLREVRLPGAPVLTPPSAASARRRGPSLAPQRRELTGLDRAAVGVVAVVALGLVWLSFSPTRAAQKAYAGDVALGAGDGNSALADYTAATHLDPHVSAYVTRIGKLYSDAGDPARARQAYERAAGVDAFDIAAVRTSGRFAEAAGDLPKARTYFERAARLDPTDSDVLLDLAKFGLAHGDASMARTVLERDVAELPADAGLWASLGDARLVAGDRAGAKQAYERALAIAPGQSVATAGLQKLAAG